MRSIILAHLIFTLPRIYSNWLEHVLVRIVADLTTVVGSAGPKLTSVTLSLVVDKE